MSDILSSARAASRAIAKMSGKRNGRTDSDQRGMRWADVVSVNGKYADVMMDGTVHSPLRYTRECEGMAKGDRVIVQYMGREPVIVGVMSSGSGTSNRIFTGSIVLDSSRFPSSYGGGTVQVFTDEEFLELTGAESSPDGNGVNHFVQFMNGDYNAQAVELSSTLYIPGYGWSAVFKSPLNSVNNVRINYMIILYDGV